MMTLRKVSSINGILLRLKHWRHAAVCASETPRQAACDAERLECIAAYARSGYFNMSSVVDMFVFIPEIPLPSQRDGQRSCGRSIENHHD
jgi:hypothetical protein